MHGLFLLKKIWISNNTGNLGASDIVTVVPAIKQFGSRFWAEFQTFSTSIIGLYRYSGSSTPYSDFSTDSPTVFYAYCLRPLPHAIYFTGSCVRPGTLKTSSSGAAEIPQCCAGGVKQKGGLNPDLSSPHSLYFIEKFLFSTKCYL